jgi:anthranilate phosphoribosyltransferase
MKPASIPDLHEPASIETSPIVSSPYSEAGTSDRMLAALRRITTLREPLTRDEARGLMAQILSGQATDAQIGALLVALHDKGETVDEVVGFAEAVREVALPIRVLDDAAVDTGIGQVDKLVDTCGTGGDGHGTFNISTVAAFVLAGAGVRVIKHGNRGLSSRCGSADVMEALGVNIELPPEMVPSVLEKTGIAFLFAPALHPAVRQVQQVRREIKLKSVFNLLGPLTNPVRPSGQVVGVYAEHLAHTMSLALMKLGASRALVVHGHDGLDEITITGPTTISEVRNDWRRTYQVSPEQFGIERASLSDVSGGDARENARILRSILSGERSPRRDIVLMNAAAGLVVAGKADSLAEAMPLSSESLESGCPLAKLNALIDATNSVRSHNCDGG